MKREAGRRHGCVMKTRFCLTQRIRLRRAHYSQYIILGNLLWAKCLAHCSWIWGMDMRSCRNCWVHACHATADNVAYICHRYICTLQSISSRYHQHTCRKNMFVASLSTRIMLLPELAASVREHLGELITKMLHRHESPSSKKLVLKYFLNICTVAILELCNLPELLKVAFSAVKLNLF